MSGSTPSTGISTAATPQTNNPATSEVPVNTPTETPDIDFRAANADADPLAAVTAEPPTASPTGGATTGTDGIEPPTIGTDGIEPPTIGTDGIEPPTTGGAATEPDVTSTWAYRSQTWLFGTGLACVFLVTHGFMIHQAVGPVRSGSTDVDLYAWWVAQGQVSGGWVGVHANWVYPVGALVPMLLAGLFGTGLAYLPTWCYLVAALNLGTALVAVKVVGVRRALAPLSGWFLFLLLLGPVGIARLDAVMMPLVLMGLLLAATRPALASGLYTFSAWVKVSGGGAIIPLFCTLPTWRERWLRVVLPAALTCAVVVVTQRLGGGDWRFLTSFVAAENTRGLQVEAVLATPAVLGHVFKHEVLWQYNHDLGTSETWGPAADAALAVSAVALPAVAIGVGLLCWLARHRPTEALLLGTLAIMTGLIVAHKVGSPQFVAWTAPAVVVALCLRRDLKFWLGVGAALLLAAAATGLLYPWGYMDFLNGLPFMVTVWVVRNLLLVGVFGAAVVRLARLARWPSVGYLRKIRWGRGERKQPQPEPEGSAANMG